jgi:heme A synthase
LSPSRARLATAAWWLLGYTVLVILWGAFVRATGAGAGCGSHWPLCNGEVIPRSPALDTVIELCHRLSSGLLGILVVVYTALALRVFPAGHLALRGAFWSTFFVFVEALIGAGLVRFEWVADDVSEERVYVVALHLVNTFLLLGAMTLTAWGARGGGSLAFRGRTRVVPLAAALLSLLAVGASGAVTALGDTLVLGAGIAPEDSPVVADLVASRFYHPSLAVASFLVVLGAILWLGPRAPSPERRSAHAVLALFGLQLLLGAINVLSKAPIVLQIAHLLVSDLLWIAAVLFAAETLRREGSPEAGA